MSTVNKFPDFRIYHKNEDTTPYWSGMYSPGTDERIELKNLNSNSDNDREQNDKIAYFIYLTDYLTKKLTGVTFTLNFENIQDQYLDLESVNIKCSLYAFEEHNGNQYPLKSWGNKKGQKSAVYTNRYPFGSQTFSFDDLDITFESYDQQVHGAALYVVIENETSPSFLDKHTVAKFPNPTFILTFEDEPEPGPGPGYDPPSVSTPVFTIATPQEVDPDYAADLADIWISGVSKAVVSAAVESEAEITSVSFTYSGHTEPVQMTLQGGFYVATTPTAVTQGMTFTVTANAGGLTGSSDPTTLNGVQAYSAPSVNVDDIFRCNWSGERADGGECYKLKISTNVSSLQDKNYQEQNGITVLEVGILNASGNVVHLHNLSNNNNWQGPFADLDDDDAIYTIVVRIKDKVGRESETRVSINGKLLDIVMYRDTEYNKTHLGVGMKPDVSKGNGNATIQLPVGAKIIVGGTDITDWLREQIGGTW